MIVTLIDNVIRKLRFEHGEMTRQALADACGISPPDGDRAGKWQVRAVVGAGVPYGRRFRGGRGRRIPVASITLKERLQPRCFCFEPAKKA
jgi:hypothetical protein